MINEDNAIEVTNVYKTFDVYYDKANTIKEKVLFQLQTKEKTIL